MFIVPITVSQRPPDIQEITKGDLVLLTVKARTDESVNLQYQWFFKDKKYDINPPEFVVYDPVTLEAYINTTVLTEEEYKTINGTYIREVFYSLDRVNITTMVVLKELPGMYSVCSFVWCDGSSDPSFTVDPLRCSTASTASTSPPWSSSRNCQVCSSM